MVRQLSLIERSAKFSFTYRSTDITTRISAAVAVYYPRSSAENPVINFGHFRTESTSAISPTIA